MKKKEKERAEAASKLDIPILSYTVAEQNRLVAAGFRPVVRWVDVRGKSDKPLKTIEALTLLDRREKKS